MHRQHQPVRGDATRCGSPRYTSPGTLPAGWGYHTFWQYTEAGGLDRDRFNGSFGNLTRFVRG